MTLLSGGLTFHGLRKSLVGDSSTSSSKVLCNTLHTHSFEEFFFKPQSTQPQKWSVLTKSVNSHLSHLLSSFLSVQYFT